MSMPSWNRLWHQITQDLGDPKNQLLSEGCEIHGQLWEDAFEVYLLGGFVERFWGEGTREIWRVGRENDGTQ